MIGHTIHGNGPTRAIVLHGWFSDSRIYEPMRALLAPELMTLAFIDFRGYGASANMAGPFNMATIVDDALALADHLGWSHFSIIGHSMGGKAALLLAVTAPTRVQRIVAIAPIWAGAVPFDQATLSMFRGAVESPAIRQGIIRSSTGGRLPPIWVKTLAETSLAVSSKAAYGGYLESWATDDFALEAQAIEQSTLVVLGKHDMLKEAMVRSTWLASLRNTDLRVLVDSGHWPMHECPPLLAQIVAGFLSA
jgi:pimeloyl-ACP methyl ester carboxylesterase